MSQLYLAPTIEHSSAIDNPSEADHELLNIFSTAPSSVTPSYIKIIADCTTLNTLSQKIFTLKNDDYNYDESGYSINILFNVQANQNFILKAKVVYSDGNFTAYSTMYSFTSSPTTPEILSAFGDSISSIFLTVTPQPEVTSYTAVLSYTNYTTIKQLDVVENLTTTDETKQFIEITNLLQNVEYVISIYAINANGQSYLSNSITSTTIPTPDPPTNVTATFDTNANVSLSWIAPLNGIHLSIDSYLIQDDSGNTIETISGSLTSYTFSNSYSLNETYSFLLIAVHTVSGSSFNSVASNISTINIPEPSEVQSLQIVSIDPGTLLISLFWDPPANNNLISTTSYNIVLDGLTISNTSSTAFTYTGAPNQTYSFSIVPLHFSYISSLPVNINAQIPFTGAPRNLVTNFDNTTAIILTWIAPCNNSTITTNSYNIYDSSSGVLLGSTSLLTYTFPNQTAGILYSYFVKSVHGPVESNVSSSVSAITIPIPTQPISITSSFDSSATITVSWTAPTNSLINIDSYQVFDIINNQVLSPVASVLGLNNYSFVVNRPAVTYSIGSTYSFYVQSLNKTTSSIPSITTAVNLPIPTAPLSLTSIVNTTTPPTVSLAWIAPANNVTISTDSYNVYQNGTLIHNVVSPTLNTDPLVPGTSYTFVVKPLHGTIEYNSPTTITVVPYQAATSPINFTATPKNQSIILSWSDPLNTGGAPPLNYKLSYGTLVLTIPISATGYSQTISGLTNKSTYTFSLYLNTSMDGVIILPGSSVSVTSVPTGLPIVNAISLSNNNLTATIDNNGSNLIATYAVISYDINNVPTSNSYSTPTALAGIVSISQPVTGVKETLIVANQAGIVLTNTP